MRKPARGLANRGPGGSGAPADRHYDRSPRSSVDQGLTEAGKTPARAGPGKPGSGAEPILDTSGPASAAVERREAGGPRRGPLPRPQRLSGGDIWGVARTMDGCACRRSASLFFVWEDMILSVRAADLGCQQMHRGNTKCAPAAHIFLSLSPCGSSPRRSGLGRAGVRGAGRKARRSAMVPLRLQASLSFEFHSRFSWHQSSQ